MSGPLAVTSTVDRLYTAFAALDAEGMEACYRDDVAFEDEVFTLRGRRETMGMWRMLIHGIRARSLDVWRLEHRDVRTEGTSATAQWTARYRFGPQGRLVNNVIRATFTLDDGGRIATHRDRFSFWRWSSQALGFTGLLLGWTPLVKQRVRTAARRGLERFLENGPG